LRLGDWNPEQKCRRLMDVLGTLPKFGQAMFVVRPRTVRRRPFDEPA